MTIKDNEPKTIEAVVRAGLESALIDLRTVHPCRVTVVRNDGTVNVDLMIHSVFNDGTNRALPSITRLPVLFSGSGQYAITFPIAVGDEGLAIFIERDISKFLEDGETGPPESQRRNSLSDGVFLPTPISKPNKLPVVDDTLLLENGATSIEITSGTIRLNGDVEISGGMVAGQEVTANNDTIPVAVSQHGHCYIPGSGSPTISSTPSTTPAIPPSC